MLDASFGLEADLSVNDTTTEYAAQYQSPCRGCKGNGNCCGKRNKKLTPRDSMSFIVEGPPVDWKNPPTPIGALMDVPIERWKDKDWIDCGFDPPKKEVIEPKTSFVRSVINTLLRR